MSVSKEDILSAIEAMSIKEVVELTEAIEEKFGVSAAQVMAAPAVGGASAGDAQAEEKTEFKVVLTGFGDKKVAVIKEVRAITSLGLKEAKEMVETEGSVVKEGLSKEEAEKMKKQLEEAGASVELK